MGDSFLAEMVIDKDKKLNFTLLYSLCSCAEKPITTVDKMNLELEQRITCNPEQCGGRPCIRGMRIRVADILEMLAEGVSQEEILDDFPDLEIADIQACLYFAVKRMDIVRLAA
uniref:Uncharacterized conserved protein, DUF433 family n=2 Tax=unclassified Candidatus Kentrum TaxID=2643149 RepID=A0A451BP47_9GAMM|nr:MAG: Uncharacterized conserved protein, DUF433 family [Candidatus Kentron sp. SD]VFK44836.1 MAG: Uncharacterized conserved protein, DUF433 family [Candidatus Kentron sp. SD]VFK80044.1 MAG: Uncharacterized conserved protein, DUF433 family [Candidatus Kentron sp. SD]